MASSRHPGSAKSGWRGSPESPETRRRSRLIGRAVWTLVGLTLLAALVWGLWWWLRVDRAHLAGFSVVEYDVGTVPPLAFTHEDLAAFRAVHPQGPEAVPLWGELQRSDGLTKLDGRLAAELGPSGEGVILYVVAHGASDDGGAYLLCSDFLRGADLGRQPVSVVLDQLAGCPAPWKLLLLDAGRLAGDRRLGMLANEFPRLLEQRVAEVDDPTLWVLCSCRSLEQSEVCRSARRSVFGFFVAEGLRGRAGADQDGDDWVELDELYRFVHHGVRGWVEQESGGRQSQSPWLLQGGQGAADPPGGLRLLPRSYEAAEESDEPQETDQPDGEQEPNESATGEEASGDDGGAFDSGETAGDGREDDANADAGDRDTPPEGDEQFTRLLARAWRLRDAAVDRGPDAAWTPVDYAPHLWREFQELLLGLEARSRAGGAYDRSKLVEKLELHVFPLEDLLAGRPLPEDLGPQTILHRLQAARAKFHDRFGPGGPDWPPELHEAMQLRNDLLAELPDYVRWHALASLAASRRQPGYAEALVPLLGGTGRPGRLRDYIAQIDGLVQSTEAGVAGETLAAELRSLAEATQQLRPFREKLRLLRAAVETDDAERATRLAAHRRKPGRLGEIEAALAAPLLPVDARTELLDLRDRFEQKLSLPATTPADPVPLRHQTDAVRWGLLHDWATLEVGLVGLVDPAAARGLDVPGTFSKTPKDTLWTQYRALGRGLAEFYAGLPDRLAGAAAGSSAPAQRQAARLLRAVDPRDARRIRPEDAAALALPEVRLPEAPPEFTLLGEPEIRISPVEPTTPLRLELDVDDDLVGREVLVRMVYDAGKVEVGFPGRRVAGSPGEETFAAELTGTGTSLKCMLTPKVRDASTVKLNLTATCGDCRDAHAMLLHLPAEDTIELLVHRLGRTGEHPVEQPARFQLRPFPNRETSYRVELDNRSPRPKRVSVSLLGVPGLPRGEKATEELLVDRFGMPRRDVEVLARTEPFELPAESGPVPVPFAPPEKPAESETAGGDSGTRPPADGSPAAPAAGDPATADAPARAITPGLACVLRDEAEGKPVWVRWLDFSPRRPAAYLDPSLHYQADSGRIEVDLRLVEQADLLFSEKHPVAVGWTLDESLDAANRVPRAVLTPRRPEGRLLAVLEDRRVGRRRGEARMEVDGDPRAFVWRLALGDFDLPDEPPEEHPVRLHLASPKDGAAFRSGDPVPVVVEVDAPQDAFRDAEDRVELRLLDARTGRELTPVPQSPFYADRDFRIAWVEAEASGRVTVGARVDDFRFAFRPGVADVEARLVAELHLSHRAGPPPRHAVEFVVDGRPPEFELTAEPRLVVESGQPLVLIARGVRDLSGVETIVFGIDRDRSGDLGESEPQQTVWEADLDGNWSARFKTQELLPPESRAAQNFHALAVATDRAGNPPATEQVVLTIKPPKMPRETGPDGTPPEKKTGTIEGRVVWDLGGGIGGIAVKLPTADAATTTDDQGRFRFSDVPLGEHTLEIRGTAKGRVVRPDDDPTVKLTDPDRPAQVTVTIGF